MFTNIIAAHPQLHPVFIAADGVAVFYSLATSVVHLATIANPLASVLSVVYLVARLYDSKLYRDIKSWIAKHL